MSDAVNREAQILAQAAEQDMARQRQIENQKQSLNRMLDRENEVRSICEEAVADGNNSSYVDRILDVLNG
jgi:hypothetical protein